MMSANADRYGGFNFHRHGAGRRQHSAANDAADDRHEISLSNGEGKHHEGRERRSNCLARLGSFELRLRNAPGASLSRTLRRHRHDVVREIGRFRVRIAALKGPDLRRPRRGPKAKGNDVAEPTIKPVCPKMCPSGGIDELSRDPHSVGRFANAPFQHVAHPKLAPDLLHVDGAPLVRETRVAGDDYSEDDTFLFPLKARSSPRNLNQLAVTPDRYRRLSRDSASS